MMNESRTLADLLDESVRRHPTKIAIVVPNRERVTYARLGSLSDRMRDRVAALGVVPGDRVALYLNKSVAAVAAIFGVLKAGAAYIPIDPDCPPNRAAYIIEDCGIKLLIADRQLEPDLRSHLEQRGTLPMMLFVKEGSGDVLESVLDSLEKTQPAQVVRSCHPTRHDVAYILYTSGSTGTPKGVTLTHANAFSFIDWCSETFGMRTDDCLSSHAPFHFDLSIFDIFVAVKHACTLVLIDTTLGKEVMRLAATVALEGITVWYSTPSILAMMATYGKMQLHDYGRLRLVLFAGEAFPISKYLRLRQFWKHTRCFNLYGPTETNVCTWYELPPDDVVALMPSIPIGKMCPPNLGLVIDECDLPVSGGEGELIVSGPNVMRGYWNLQEKNASVFITDSEQRRWYRTGDIVVSDSTVGFIYVGRRDRMVKRRGYRIELGDIEAALLRTEIIQEAGVVATPDEESGVRITAFVANGPGIISRAAVKAAALAVLPRYMIPDAFVPMDNISRTSTNKIDYEELKRRVAGSQ